jgi:hypothetical protein
MRRRVRAQAAAREHPALARLRLDPAEAMRAAGLRADDWQREVLSSQASRLLLLTTRQAGKSSTVAALALRTALLRPRATVLMLSPSEKQSAEVLRKAQDYYAALDRPIPTLRPRDSALKLELANGSRLLALPGNERTVRCYSAVTLLVVDEASRVPDPLYYSLRPMLATSGGQLVALSTPAGKRGWFYESWAGPEAWHRVCVPAERCPRIGAEFLAEERRVLGPRWYAQEYECSFEDLLGAAFRGEDIDAALADPTVKPLWEE